jgi:HEAT repeat protein
MQRRAWRAAVDDHPEAGARQPRRSRDRRRSVSVCPSPVSGDADASVQEAAAAALGKLGDPARLVDEGAVAALLDALARGGDEVRRAAAGSLGRIGPRIADRYPDAADAIIASLYQALGDPDVVVRRVSARALGEIGAKSDRWPDIQLLALLHDPDEETRRNAADALGKLGDETAVDGLVAVLRGLHAW